MHSLTRRQSLLLGAGAAGTAALASGHALAAAAERGAAVTNGGYANPGWLVSADWLKRHLNHPMIKVVALTPAADFTAGHIPGAAEIDWPDLRITDTSQASVARWQGNVEQKLGKLGISPADTVVTYDGGTLFAARLWWVLDHLGHRDKRLLNGGLVVWPAAGGALERGKSTVEPAATPYNGTPNPADLATLDEVKASLGKPHVVLLDTRTKAEYVRGHIPGAVNINYPENALPHSPHFWKPAPALHQLYAPAGVTPDKEVIPYCSTGVRSAVTWFTLRLIGYPDVRLYTGSWDEWSQHPELPKVTGDRP